MEPHKEHPEATHTEVHSPAVKNSRESFFSRSLYALLAVLLLLVLGVALQRSLGSLPGDRLYTLKVHLVEPALLYTNFTDTEKVAYSVSLLEKRFHELELLSLDSSTSTPEVLVIVGTLSDAHAFDASNALTHSTSLRPEEKINALSKVVDITNAEDSLVASTPEFASLEDSLAATRKGVGDIMRLTVHDFASTSPATDVVAYIALQVAGVEQEIKKVAQGSDAQRRALSRISEAQDAISEGDLAQAISSLLKAKEMIAVDGYLFDSERGPIEGAPVPTTEIPEGN